MRYQVIFLYGNSASDEARVLRDSIEKGVVALGLNPAVHVGWLDETTYTSLVAGYPAAAIYFGWGNA